MTVRAHIHAITVASPPPCLAGTLTFGLHLPPWLSDILLDRAHLTVKRYGPLAYYGIILDCFYMDTIQDVQEFVKNSGFDPLQLNFDAE